MALPILSRTMPKMGLLIPLAIFAGTGVSFAAEPPPAPPEGLIAYIGSFAAAGMLGFAVLIAWLLNHAQPKLRASGTALAGVACLTVVAWFAAALGTGVVADPKAPQAPMDNWKPALIWAQAGTALIGAGVLFAVAFRQARNTETLALSNANEAKRYGRVSRMIHWTTAMLFISMIPMGIFMSMIPSDVWYRGQYGVAHETIGVAILGLVIFRVIWNRYSIRPSLEASLTRTEHRLAHGAHILLYVLLFAIPITGYVMTTMHGFPLLIFTLRLDALWGESDAYIYWGLFHKYLLQYLVYLVLGAHVLGALKHQFIDKHDSAFKRMVS